MCRQNGGACDQTRTRSDNFRGGKGVGVVENNKAHEIMHETDRVECAIGSYVKELK